jgi:hypothetical protein
MADPFASSWAKLDRAQQHFDLLKAQLAEAADPKEHPVTFKTEYQPEPYGLTRAQRVFAQKIAKKMRVAPPPLLGADPERAIIRIATMPHFTFRHSLLLGEAVNGCRASLDHLAWALVKVHKAKLTESQRQKIAFPMMRRQKNFVRNCQNGCLRGVPAKPFIALAERYQPYKRTVIGRTMRALRNLSNMDKHRFIIPIATPMAGAGLNVELNRCWRASPNIPHVWPANPDAPRRALKPGTKIVDVLIIRQDGQGDVAMKGYLGVYPRLPGTYLPAAEQIDQFSAVCTEILSEFEALL